MSFYVACTNPPCPEEGVPKETPDSFRTDFDAGRITCGRCTKPITTEVDAPPNVEPRFDLEPPIPPPEPVG